MATARSSRFRWQKSKTKSKQLPKRAAMLSFYTRSCGGHTRMTGMRNLPVPHAPLEVGLAKSKCSFGLCQPRVAFHTRMLGMQNLPVPHAALEVGLAESKCSSGLCQPRAAFHTRMPGTQNLPVLHAPPAILLPVSTCSHRTCVPGKAAFSHFSIPSKGGMGACPHVCP